MREIKFRAWDRQINRHHFFDASIPELGLAFWKIVDDESMPIMQFTGLKDKNGKEIYEGDIIEWQRGYVDDSPMDLWPNKPYVCKFINGKFILHCTPNGSGGYILGFDGTQNTNGVMTNSTIIGNIYENP